MLRRTWIITLEVIGLMLALLVLGTGALVMRLTAGPIDVRHLTPMIEHSLSASDGSWRVDIEDTLLTWSKESRAFRFLLRNAQLHHNSGVILLDVPELVVRANFKRLFSDLVSPLEIEAAGIQINLQRLANGDIIFLPDSQHGQPDTQPPDTDSLAPTDPAETAESATSHPSGQPNDTALSARAVSAALARVAGRMSMIGAVKLRQARVSLENEQNQTIWQANATQLDWVTDHQGLYLHAALEVMNDNRTSKTDVWMAWQENRDFLGLEINLTDLDALAQYQLLSGNKFPFQLNVPVTGTIKANLNAQLEPVQLNWDLAIGQGTLVWRDRLPEPVSVQAGACRGTINLAQHTGQIDECSLSSADPTLSAKAQMTPQSPATEAGPQPMNLVVDLDVKKLPLDQLGLYWPEGLGKNPRKWILKHMSGGEFSHLTSQIQLSGVWGDWNNWNFGGVKGEIHLNESNISYHSNFPPVEKLSAKATYDTNTIHAQILSGQIGQMLLNPAPLVIRDLSGDLPAINITAHVTTSVQDAMAVLEKPPLKLSEKSGLKPGSISGKADLMLNFDFPLLSNLTFDQIIIKAEGTLSDLASDQLLKDLSLSMGQVKIELQDDIFSASGKINANGAPAAFNWREDFKKSAMPPRQKGSLQATVSDWQWDKMGVPVKHYWRGPVMADVAYTGGGQNAQIQANLDFTRAALVMDEFGFRKPQNQPAKGQASITITTDKQIKIEKFSAEGEKISLSGEGLVNASGEAETFVLKAAPLGINNFTLRMSRAEGVPTIDVNGTQLVMPGVKLTDIKVPDAVDEPKPSQKQQEDQPETSEEKSASRKEPVIFRVNVDKLITAKEKYFAPLRLNAERDQHGWRVMQIHTVTHKGIPFNLHLREEGKVYILSAATPDFGAMLSAWDAMEDLKGGELMIEGKGEEGNPRRIRGEAKLKNFRIKNLPVLATLINAVSITGLPEALAGEGLNFEKFEGDFELDGDQLILTQWMTSGSNIGLNAEGIVNLESKEAKLAGSVVPFNMINRVLSDIPLVGDIVAGGYGGGLFATNFILSGKLDKLEAEINPFSAFTPGIFRKLFFNDTPRSLK